MVSYSYLVSDKQGLHAANAVSLSRAASDYTCNISLIRKGKRADCKNVLALLSLGARQGDRLELLAEGPDEEQAAIFLKDLMRTIL